MSLRDSLEAAGLRVRTISGWGTRGGTWKVGKPMGVMHHHTAPPVPFPVDRLYGDLLKCNINTKPDGTVWLIAQKACNFSSGMGSNVVLTEVLSANPPTRNARERGLQDDTNGNPYFFNFENDHAGDGGPIPAVQHDAIVRSTRVVLDHYNLSAGNVISHAEWTARKIDPYWNGNRRAIEAIRQALEDDVMTPAQEAKLDQVLALVNSTPSRVLSAEFGGPSGSANRRSMALHILDIRKMIGALDSEGVSEAELDERVTHLLELLPDRVLARLRDRLG